MLKIFEKLLFKRIKVSSFMANLIPDHQLEEKNHILHTSVIKFLISS